MTIAESIEAIESNLTSAVERVDAALDQHALDLLVADPGVSSRELPVAPELRAVKATLEWAVQVTRANRPGGEAGR